MISSDNPYAHEFCRVCHGLRWSKPGATYVVRRQEWVKIGRTGALYSITERLRGLRKTGAKLRCPEQMDRAAPLALVAVFSRDVEHDLHERYAEHHVVGEWFSATDALIEDVQQFEGAMFCG